MCRVLFSLGFPSMEPKRCGDSERAHIPGKRANRTNRVLVRDLSGKATFRSCTLNAEIPVRIRRECPSPLVSLMFLATGCASPHMGLGGE